MKKEIIKKSVMLIVLVGLLIWYANLNATEKVVRNYELKKDNQIAIMVYDETAEDYVAQDTVPTGYSLDKERTYCVNGGEIISYDSATGVINYNLNTDDKCYVYLKMPELITFSIGSVYKCSGDTGYTYSTSSGQYSVVEGSTFMAIVTFGQIECNGMGFVYNVGTGGDIYVFKDNVITPCKCSDVIQKDQIYVTDVSMFVCSNW